MFGTFPQCYYSRNLIQLWRRIKYVKNPEDGDSTFSETSVTDSATRYQVYEDFFNWHRRGRSPEGGGLPTLIIALLEALPSMRPV
jgi:hypothetical protein